jgi:hypothetical protein
MELDIDWIRGVTALQADVYYSTQNMNRQLGAP